MNVLTRWQCTETLFSRAALALALAFLLFAMVATVLLQFTLVKPHTRQAADDLASFLVLSSQIWVELPPFTRPDFERELLSRHEIRILTAEARSPTEPAAHSYIDYLETSLGRLVATTVTVHTHPDYPGWLWADLPAADRLLRLGFRETRLHQRALFIVPFLAVIGLSAAFVLAIVLVRHITRPLAQISSATQRIGEGDFDVKIPETGPRELADLARKLNLMEAQIKELLASRTTLLAGISHDLRTPLARMRLELEMMGAGDHTQLKQDLNDDISEMESLIHHALLLANSSGAEHPTQADVCLIVRQAVDCFSDSSAAIIAIDCDQSIIRSVQRHALKRVVSNLIENALRYGDGQGVSVTCRSLEKGAEISVSDSGPGIPEAEREKIFRPFYRLEQSRNKGTGGSGLGLAIVAQLCRAYRWTIRVVPREGRSGSTFCLHLPDQPDQHCG